ncbi:MAG: aromatic ring-hydroxylating dioxygenase subunit alpha [Hyphomicrobiaceae bacterium]
MPSLMTPNLLSELRRIAALPLEESYALPPQVFTDEGFAALEDERIFKHAWQCVGRADELAQPGDYLTDDLGGDPIIVVRDGGGAIKAFPNICRHRAARLLEGCGNAKRIVCPYHAWTYDLDGKLLSAPFMSESFKPESVCLTSLRTEVWGGFVYVNPDPNAAPLGPQLERLSQRFHNHRLSDYRTVMRVEETWPANWKILFENFSEPYHSFIAHRTTVDPALPTRLTRHDETGEDAWTIYTQVRPPGVTYEYGAEMRVLNEALTERERAEYPIFAVFPTHLCSVSAERLFWISIRPRGPGHVRVRWGVDAYPGAMPEGEEGEARKRQMRVRFDKINGEDREIISRLQSNAASRYAVPGRLSPKENCIWEFQRYLAREMLPA